MNDRMLYGKVTERRVEGDEVDERFAEKVAAVLRRTVANGTDRRGWIVNDAAEPRAKRSGPTT